MLLSNLLEVIRTRICLFFYLVLFKVPRTSEVCSCVVSLLLWKKSHHFRFLLTEVTWTSFTDVTFFLWICWPSSTVTNSCGSLHFDVLWKSHHLSLFRLLHFSVCQSLLCRHHLSVNERDARSHVCSLDHWCKYFNLKTLCFILSFCLNCVCRNTVYMFFIYFWLVIFKFCGEKKLYCDVH